MRRRSMELVVNLILPDRAARKARSGQDIIELFDGDSLVALNHHTDNFAAPHEAVDPGTRRSDQPTMSNVRAPST
jgi:hypothetical protein